MPVEALVVTASLWPFVLALGMAHWAGWSEVPVLAAMWLAELGKEEGGRQPKKKGLGRWLCLLPRVVQAVSQLKFYLQPQSSDFWWIRFQVFIQGAIRYIWETVPVWFRFDLTVTKTIGAGSQNQRIGKE